MQTWLQPRAIRDERRAEHGGTEHVRQENKSVISIAFVAQITEQRGGFDVLMDEGMRLFIGDRIDASAEIGRVDRQQSVVDAPKCGCVARINRKTTDLQAVRIADSGCVVINCPVGVERPVTGGQHLDIVTAGGKARRNLKSLLLCAARQVCVEPGSDDSDRSHACARSFAMATLLITVRLWRPGIRSRFWRS